MSARTVLSAFAGVFMCLAFIVSSCSRENEIEGPSSDAGASRNPTSSPTKYVVDTEQELIDVFDDSETPVLVDGDTVFVVSGTYTFANHTFTQHGAKTIYFHGDPDTIPILEKTGTGKFFDFEDTTPGGSVPTLVEII